MVFLDLRFDLTALIFANLDRKKDQNLLFLLDCQLAVNLHSPIQIGLGTGLIDQFILFIPNFQVNLQFRAPSLVALLFGHLGLIYNSNSLPVLAESKFTARTQSIVF